jgi:hypothetical protein
MPDLSEEIDPGFRSAIAGLFLPFAVSGVSPTDGVLQTV